MAASAFNSTKYGNRRPASIFSSGGVNGVNVAGSVVRICAPSLRFLPASIKVNDFPRCAPRGSSSVNDGGAAEMGAAKTIHEIETSRPMALRMFITSQTPVAFQPEREQTRAAV